MKNPVVHARRWTHTAAAVGMLAVAFGLAACKHVPHRRHESADPDARLAAALIEWDDAQKKGLHHGAVVAGQEVIIDSQATRLHIEEIAAEFPNHVPTLLMCAQIASDAGEHERAAAYSGRILELQPENNYAGILRARAALADGNIPLARDVLERQLHLTPDSAYLHEVLAGVHYFGGNLAGAETELAAAERLGSEAWRVAYNRGLIAEKRGDAAGARAQYDKAMKLRPGFEAAEVRSTGIGASK